MNRALRYPVRESYFFEVVVKKVLSISSGTDNHCAVVENADPSDKHNLYCWGADYNGVITGNTEQYKGTVQNKYEGKLKTEDVHYSIEEPWNWSLYETGGDFTYIFGQPITLIKNRDIQISEDHWEKKCCFYLLHGLYGSQFQG